VHFDRYLDRSDKTYIPCVFLREIVLNLVYFTFSEEVILNEERTTDEEKIKIIEGMNHIQFYPNKA